MGKRLLVGATFRDAHPDQVEWLALQLKFLQATTSDFDHVSFVNGKGSHSDSETTTLGDIAAFDAYPTEVIGLGEARTQREPSPTSAQHIDALSGLLSYFKTKRHDYDYFLFLDNDAFPIRKGWLDDRQDGRVGPAYSCSCATGEFRDTLACLGLVSETGGSGRLAISASARTQGRLYERG